jgi:hypothetical protein
MKRKVLDIDKKVLILKEVDSGTRKGKKKDFYSIKFLYSEVWRLIIGKFHCKLIQKCALKWRAENVNYLAYV